MIWLSPHFIFVFSKREFGVISVWWDYNAAREATEKRSVSCLKFIDFLGQFHHNVVVAKLVRSANLLDGEKTKCITGTFGLCKK